MRVLLHACCGPCSLEPVRILTDEGVDFGIDFTNDNIHPEGEYEHRLETIREHVIEPNGLDFIAPAQDVEWWEKVAGVHGTDREARCRACYRMRFEQVAKHAVERGYDAISSTLTISPYQYTHIILEELQRAAEMNGLQAQLRDYSDRYQEATKRSREMGMYRQNYCGCRFSIAEAEAERKAAKAAREAEKTARNRARILAAAEGVAEQASQL